MNPEVGQAIVARRKTPSRIYHNMIVGPVIETFDNACRVQTNAGTDIETDWQIFYNDWDIEVLF